MLLVVIATCGIVLGVFGIATVVVIFPQAPWRANYGPWLSLAETLGVPIILAGGLLSFLRFVGNQRESPAGAMPGMPAADTVRPGGGSVKFSLGRLAISVMLFAIAFGVLTVAFKLPEGLGSVIVGYYLIAIACPTFCAAIGVLFRDWVKGVQIAIVVGLALAWFVCSGGLATIIQLFR